MLSAKWLNDRDALVTEALSGPDVRGGAGRRSAGGAVEAP